MEMIGVARLVAYKVFDRVAELGEESLDLAAVFLIDEPGDILALAFDVVR